MHPRDINLVGALVLAITDLVKAAAEAGAKHGAVAPAALATIGFYPGESIDALSRTLRLTHSGTVRLVDRLVADGLVERKPGKQRRSVALFLTRAGRRAHSEILQRRRQTVAGIVEPLSSAEQAQLTRLAEKLLSAVTTGNEAADFICRLCEIEACPQDRCPVHCEAGRREGSNP